MSATGIGKSNTEVFVDAKLVSDPDTAHALGGAAAQHLADGAARTAQAVDIPAASYNLGTGATRAATNSHLAGDLGRAAVGYGTGAALSGAGALVAGVGVFKAQNAQADLIHAAKESLQMATGYHDIDEQSRIRRERANTLLAVLSHEERIALVAAVGDVEIIARKLCRLELQAGDRAYVCAVVNDDTKFQQYVQDALHDLVNGPRPEGNANQSGLHLPPIGVAQLLNNSGVYNRLQQVFDDFNNPPVRQVHNGTHPWQRTAVEAAQLELRDRLTGRNASTSPSEKPEPRPHVPRTHFLVLLPKLSPVDLKPTMLSSVGVPAEMLMLAGATVSDIQEDDSPRFSQPSLHIMGLMENNIPRFCIEGVYLRHNGSNNTDKRYILAIGTGNAQRAASETLYGSHSYWRDHIDRYHWFWDPLSIGQYIWAMKKALNKGRRANERYSKVAVWDLNDCFEGFAFKTDKGFFKTPFEGREKIPNFSELAKVQSR